MDRMSDEQLIELIRRICEVDVSSEREHVHLLNLLKAETGIVAVSDYIYYPELVGLPNDISFEDLCKKILEDRK
ncbi:MAG: hypothetical protein IJ379_05315 [Lachnospiraceae bacterium]|nr:hypothetical protein [Lachnospiraceae bacterium]